MSVDITYSIVLYKNDEEIIKKAIGSLLSIELTMVLYLIDNSPDDKLKKLVVDPRILYVHNPSNPGFGAAHNLAIQYASDLGSNFHIIVNPDIYFVGNVVTPMLQYMIQHPDVGMMMPEILNFDGSIQYLPKLLPSPLWILRRKLRTPKLQHEKFVSKYELRSVPKKRVYNSPILSGCFSLLRLSAIAEVGGYDESYFMYFEDFDLSRRMHQKYKTVYFPLVSVFHSYNSEANKNAKLFHVFVSSAITYFNKFGWFFDQERIHINKNTLQQFER